MGGEIKVVIEKDGTMMLEVSGKRGAQCLTVTQSLEEELGEVLGRQRTPEFYQGARIALKNKISNPLKSA
jgi:hypothetical protein